MPVNLFDANFYRATYSDLAGFDDAQALSHFQTFGLNEVRAFSPFANLNFYRSSNSDLAAAGLNTNRQLYEHLQDFGVAEGRVFSPFADINFYLVANQDLAQAFGGNREQAFIHLQNNGINEQRRFSPFVDLEFYRTQGGNTDLAGLSNRQSFEHLQLFGLDENRLFSSFVNLYTYASTNPDLASLNDRQLFDHLQNFGIEEGRIFDETVDLNLYLSANSDVAQAFGGNREQTLQHLELNGLDERRTFSPFFDLNYYSSTNPDLLAAGLSGSQLQKHFELYGVFEGRAGRSDNVGNTLSTARNITVSSTPSFSIDFVGTSDPDDYYQFNLNQSSIVTIGFTSTPTNVRVELLNSGSQLLYSGTTTVVNRATTNIIPAESVSGFSLSAGTYFLHFQQLAGNSNHAFAIKTFTFP